MELGLNLEGHAFNVCVIILTVYQAAPGYQKKE